ncbi:hypothetical protein F5Y10DRAFT_240058 [Nemania abortiva]|nr:hypothetical protein F5Y10DRAFT_240058 [Nemania abortiva]
MVPPKSIHLPKWMADFAAADELPSSMCFQEAFAARIYDRINDEEYYRHVFAHLTGTSHKPDETEDDIRYLKNNDPFAYSVLDSAKKMNRVEDATPFEQIFKAYKANDLEAIKSGVQKMQKDHVPYLLRMLAMGAMIDKRAEVLEFCLDKGGFQHEPNFVRMADIVTKEDEPEMFRALTGSGNKKRVSIGVGADIAAEIDIGGKWPVEW